jgi:hypothetical protein
MSPFVNWRCAAARVFKSRGVGCSWVLGASLSSFWVIWHHKQQCWPGSSVLHAHFNFSWGCIGRLLEYLIHCDWLVNGGTFLCALAVEVSLEITQVYHFWAVFLVTFYHQLLQQFVNDRRRWLKTGCFKLAGSQGMELSGGDWKQQEQHMRCLHVTPQVHLGLSRTIYKPSHRWRHWRWGPCW